MSNDITRRDFLVAELVDDGIASLQEIQEGDWVEYSDGNYGAVTGVVEGPLDWPTGEEETEEVGESGDTVYVVAHVEGGSKPYTADELDVVDRDTVIDEDEMPDEPEEDVDGAEMAAIYGMVHQTDVVELHRKSPEELISVPLADDPGTGFDSWPPSWKKADAPARLIALDAWTSLGSTWTGCMAEIGSRRICSAFKDSILQTDRWRGRF